MTVLTPESQAWLWDFERHKAHVRHWPAITQGLVHVHDLTDLAPMRRQATRKQDPEAWMQAWADTLPSSEMVVAVDSIAEMLDLNRENCLGSAIGLKSYSESLFALARGEVLTQLPFPARLALLAEGLASIADHTSPQEVRSALSELTVTDLQKLAQPLSTIPSRLKKGELVSALAAAAESGQLKLPLGPITAAPSLQPWLQHRIQLYVQALKDSLRHCVYPQSYREAVWRQALQQVNIEPMREAIEVAYWQVLESSITDPNTPSKPAETSVSAKNAADTVTKQWHPGLSRPSQDIAWAWLAVAILILLWWW